jgi:hypothetical protein
MPRLQIVKSFARRTEYKVLREWFEVEEKEMSELQPGICVIPGIVLLKMSDAERIRLIEWARIWGNQVMVSPPFHHVDISSLLQMNDSLFIKEIDECTYEGIPVHEEIVSNLTPKIRLPAGKVIAVDFYYDTGSGCITVTTLPLLDYRLLQQGEACRQLFQSLIINRETTAQEEAVEQNVMIIEPIHQYLLLLAAAGTIDCQQLVQLIQNYFFISVDEKKVENAFIQLQHTNYIHLDGTITATGIQYISEKGLHAFVREIKKRRQNDGEW